jgi:hypothetical protein
MENILGFSVYGDNIAAQFRFLRQRDTGAKSKDQTPEKEVGFYLQEGLAKSHKVGNMKDGI